MSKKPSATKAKNSKKSGKNGPSKLQKVGGQPASKKVIKQKFQKKSESAATQQNFQTNVQQVPIYNEEPFFDNMPMQEPMFDPRMMYDSSQRNFNQS